MKMHNKIYIGVFSSLLMMAACQKQAVVPAPTFDVTPDSIVVGVNQAVTFQLTGDADQIAFFPGDSGRNYEYRTRDTIANGKPLMSFTSLRQFGATPQGTADSTLELLISMDYNNGNTEQDIEAATWTDITSRATFSYGLSSTVYISSGSVDLSDFQKPGPNGEDTSVYIAFRYHDYQSSVSQRTWTIKTLSIDNLLPDSSLVNIGNLANMTWGIVNIMGTPAWTANTTQLSIAGGAINSPENLDWVITKPLQLNRVKRDVGISVKTNPTTIQTKYSFAGYKNPGTYSAVFVAQNVNRWDLKTVVKKFTITVEPPVQ